MHKRKIFTTEDGSASLIDLELDETYHSRHGALSESIHVFIEHGLLSLNHSGGKFRVLEIGFGTGLNAWLTFIEAQKNKYDIYYCGLEPFPVDELILQKLNYHSMHGKEKYKEHFFVMHRADWDQQVAISDHFKLHKRACKIQDFDDKHSFDLVYFDAFAPQKQPEMWNYEVLKKVCAHMITGGVLVTYCAKGQFKRDLKALGMKVESPPGPPGKREMVRAIKMGEQFEE